MWRGWREVVRGLGLVGDGGVDGVASVCGGGGGRL